LANGADPNNKDNDFAFGALEKALDPAMINLLIEKGAKINHTNKSGVTLIMKAASVGNINLLKALLAKDPDLSVQDQQGRTAYLYACNLEILKILIENKPKNISLNKLISSQQENLLLVAAEKNNIPMVKYLLEQGIPVNSTNVFKETPLFVAVKNNYHELINLLLLYKADPAIKNINGQSAQDLAKEKYNSTKATAELLKAK